MIAQLAVGGRATATCVYRGCTAAVVAASAAAAANHFRRLIPLQQAPRPARQPASRGRPSGICGRHLLEDNPQRARRARRGWLAGLRCSANAAASWPRFLRHAGTRPDSCGQLFARCQPRHVYPPVSACPQVSSDDLEAELERELLVRVSCARPRAGQRSMCSLCPPVSPSLVCRVAAGWIRPACPVQRLPRL